MNKPISNIIPGTKKRMVLYLALNFSRISIYTLNENFANTNTLPQGPNLGTWVFTYANLVSPYRLIYETHFP
nr:MAG TPA: hypothetical protein [Bacteriophage sp.]